MVVLRDGVTFHRLGLASSPVCTYTNTAFERTTAVTPFHQYSYNSLVLGASATR